MKLIGSIFIIFILVLGTYFFVHEPELPSNGGENVVVLPPEPPYNGGENVVVLPPQIEHDNCYREDSNLEYTPSQDYKQELEKLGQNLERLKHVTTDAFTCAKSPTNSTNPTK
jgi:hypothetical protein